MERAINRTKWLEPGRCMVRPGSVAKVRVLHSLNMLNNITSSVSDSLAMCPEYKVVIPLRRDRLCRIRKAKKAHLRQAGEVTLKA